MKKKCEWNCVDGYCLSFNSNYNENKCNYNMKTEEDSGHSGLKPTDAGYKWFTCPTCDGTAKISQDQQNELASLRNQLAKQEVAFRETVKIQHEEILHLKNAIATMCKTITTT